MDSPKVVHYHLNMKIDAKDTRLSDLQLIVVRVKAEKDPFTKRILERSAQKLKAEIKKLTEEIKLCDDRLKDLLEIEAG